MAVFCGLHGALDVDDNLSPEEVFQQHCVIMTQIPLFRGLSYLLLSNYEMFARFQCYHEDAHLSNDQIRKTAAIFGHKIYGFGAIMATTGLRIPRHMVEELEEVLSLNLRYLSCFITEDFPIYKLLPENAHNYLYDFHVQLNRIILEITTALQASRLQSYFPSTAVAVSKPLPVLPLIRQLQSLGSSSSGRSNLTDTAFLDQQLNAYLAKYQPISSDTAQQKQLLLDDMSLCSDLVKRIDKYTARQVTNSSFSQIMHPVIFDIWVECFGNDLQGKLHRFVEVLNIRLNAVSADLLSAQVKDKMLQTIEVLVGSKDNIDAYTVSKVFRCVSREDLNILSILKTMISLHSGRRFALLPPAPVEQIYFNSDQEEDITGMFRCPGWHMLLGPHRSGKSCRLLKLVHQFLTASSTNTSSSDTNSFTTTDTADVIWLDFSKIHSETDGYSRLASQLFLKRCNTKETMTLMVSELLQTMKPCSLVVVDNICPGHATWKSFLEDLFGVFAQHPTHVYILCSTDRGIFEAELTKLRITAQSQVKIKFMDMNVALTMAQSMTPDTQCASSFLSVDPKALVTASCGLSGDIRYLASICTLSQYRQVSRDIIDMNCDPTAIHNSRNLCSQMIFACLPFDCKLVAYCLNIFSRVTYFDMGLAFALCSKFFDGDLTRFRLAWNHLVDLQWVQHHPEFGFHVSVMPIHLTIRMLDNPNAVKHPNLSYIPTYQQLFDSYLIYWANELKRINSSADQNPAVLEEFTFRLTHFSVLLQCVFFKSTVSIPSNSGKLSGRKSSLASLVAASDSESLLGAGGVGSASSMSLLSTVNDFGNVDIIDEYFVANNDPSPIRFNEMLISSVARVECICLLAGNIGRVLSYHLSGASANRIATILDSEISRFAKGNASPEELQRFNEALVSSQLSQAASSNSNSNSNEVMEQTISMVQDAAKIDLAEQCLRQSHITEGLAHAQQAAQNAMANAMTDRPSNSSSYTSSSSSSNSSAKIVPYVRALLVFGRLLIADQQTLQASTYLKQAAACYAILELDSAMHWEYGLCQRLVAETDLALSVKNAMETTPNPKATESKSKLGFWKMKK